MGERSRVSSGSLAARAAARGGQRTTILGLPLKNFSLVLLTFQYSLFILTVHYSRRMPAVGGQRYLTSTAVFLNELLKLGICLTVALYDISRTLPPSLPLTSLFGALSSAIFSGDSWKLAIPASLYTLSNSLQYIGISNLDAATFQVTYQLKIITTALFSIGLLGRNLSAKRWLSLLLLMIGVAIVQLPTGAGELGLLENEQTRSSFARSLDSLERLKHLGGQSIVKRSATYEGIEEDLLADNPHLNTSIGLLATVGACLASGLAGVYFEKVLKDSANPTSLWVRNVQLAIYSLFPAFFIGVIFVDGEEIAKHGFFAGYNWVVCMAIGLQALGGVVVALCVNYADNIAKNFAVSISIVLSALASFWFFELDFTGSFLLGTTIVLAATYLYSDSSNNTSTKSRPPPITISSEKGFDYIQGDSANAGANGASAGDFSIRLPTTPMMSENSVTSSRPTTPGPGPRGSASKGFLAKHRDD